MTHTESLAKPATPGSDQPLLSVANVSKSFGGVKAVTSVDFEVAAGEVHALVGENGAGKSTLMKIIAGVLVPDEGQIEFGGETRSFRTVADAEKAGIVMVPQEIEMFDNLSLAENLYVGRSRPRRGPFVDWQAMTARTKEVFGRLGLDVDPRASAKDLSVATRQLALIARGLIGEARLILMDEPTSSLTDTEAAKLSEIIRDLTVKGVGVVYVSHKVDEIFAVSDRYTVLRDGELIGRRSTSASTPGELVHMMVGRPLEELYTRTSRQRGRTVLKTEGLTRTGEYEDISLVVHAGEVVALAGLIGAGRTEVAETIAGIRTADSGTIEVDGKQVSPRSPRAAQRAKIAYLPEERRSQGLILPFSIEDNISFGALDLISRFGFLSRAQERKIAKRYFEALGIRGGGPQTPVANLSGGNQQKVLIGKTLARSPRLILMDEPTRGVDVGAKSDIYRIIDDLAAAGNGVLLISSEMAEVLAIADRIVVMREGSVAVEFDREEATQHRLMAAASGGDEDQSGTPSQGSEL